MSFSKEFTLKSLSAIQDIVYWLRNTAWSHNRKKVAKGFVPENLIISISINEKA